MRHTFGTLLSKSEVMPRTAQAAMRHSKIDLTMNVYTDPRLLNVHGAVEALPALPLSGGERLEQIAVRATGTDDLRASQFAVEFAVNAGQSGVLQSTPVRKSKPAASDALGGVLVASACPVKRNNPLTTAVNGLLRVGVTGLEPVTSSLSSWRSNQLS